MSLLQPLDVCLNKPFKGEIHKLWNNWMTEGDKPLTATGNLKRPSIPLVIGWIKTTWGCTPEEMVRKSLLKCSISNKMDGMEDDALYEDFHGYCVAEAEDVADSDGYGDYYDDSVATCEIQDYDWVSFFVGDNNDLDFDGF